MKADEGADTEIRCKSQSCRSIHLEEEEWMNELSMSIFIGFLQKTA